MRTYVFAANYEHFRYWCRSNGISDRNKNYQYVAEAHQLWGLKPEYCLFVFYETWADHPNSTDIYMQYKAIESLRGIKAIPIDRSPQVESTDGFFTWKFWRNTLERMVRSFAAGILGLNVTNLADWSNLGWKTVLMAGVTMSVMSLLFALVGSRFGNDTADPSFIKQEK